MGRSARREWPSSIFTLMIAGQGVLVAIAAITGSRALFLVGVTKDIYGTESPLAWIQLATFAVMMVAYLRAGRGNGELEVEQRTLFVTLGIVTFLAVIQIPTSSRDVYAYVAIGRVATVFGLDPWAAVYPLVAGDPFRPFVWILAPSSYGPLALLLFVPAAWLSHVHPALGILFIKLASGGAFILCAWLVYKLAGALGRAPKRALFLFGFNPLLQNELVANAHVDVWAVALVLAGIWLVQTERFRSGAVVALMPALIKLSFLSTAAATAVWLAARRRFAALVLMGLAAAAVSVAFYLVFDPDLRTLLQITDPRSLGRENTLFHWLEVGLVSVGLEGERATQWITIAAQVAMVVFVLVAAVRLARVKKLEDLVAELALLFLVLLLFGPRLWPWYLAWLLPFAILTRSSSVREAALVFSATSFLLYIPTGFPRLRVAAILVAVLVPAADWLVTSRRR